MRKFIQGADLGENHWAFYGLTIVVILLGFTLGQIPIGMLVSNVIESGSLSVEEVNAFKTTLNFEPLGLPPFIGLTLMLIGPVLALGVLCLSVIRVHKRPIKTVVSGRPKVDISRILFAFSLWMLLSFLVDLIMYWLFPDSYTFNTDIVHWLPLLAVSLCILPLQTTF